MGVVYLARDTRLDRDVAIKALPATLASEPARLERFEREAKTLAQLNHPNIGQIYGIEEQDGCKYLILEYVEGETLADRLDRGPMPVDEAIETACAIALGLEAAHDASVIHRDLKPANIKITPDGKVKVLDFGLAKADEGTNTISSMTGVPGSPSQSPTLTSPQPVHSPTSPGAILGTAPYMSPEQARGRSVDKRTDVWSFGVMLYEMLTGIGPFHGETASDSIGAVLHKDIDLDKLPSSVSPSVHRVLRHCLERDKTQRYRDIGDVRIELLQSDEPLDVARKQPAMSRGTLMMTVLVTAVVAAAIAGSAGWMASQRSIPEPERVVRKFVVYTVDTESQFDAISPRISPDGMKIAFIENDAICVRDLATFEIQTIVEAKGLRRVTWSPDGRSLAYTTGSSMFRVPATGGGSTKIGDLDTAFDFAWDDADRLLFGDEDSAFNEPSIAAIPARGGTTERLITASEEEVIDFHAVAAIPGTDVIVYVRHLSDQRTPIEAWDGERTVVIGDFEDTMAAVPVWSPSGHILFSRGFGERSIWAVPFSPVRMEVTGDPFLVQADASSPSVSASGTLAFARGSPGMSGELIWILSDGSIETIGNGGEFVTAPVVSPDGTRIAFAAGSTPADLEIWVRDLERGINTRISSSDGFVFPSAWSPDGTEIAVMSFDPSNRETGQQTMFLASDGSGPTHEVYPGLLAAFDQDWTHAVQVSDPRGGRVNIAVVDLAERTVIGEISSTQGNFLFLSISPDGAYLLYESSESGEQQVYCTRFPSGEGRWQVSSEGGRQPKWSPDGSTVYYQNNDADLMTVEVTHEPTLRFGIPRRAFDVSPNLADFAYISPAPDGERFVSVRSRDEDATGNGSQILMIENWFDEFRKR